MFFVNNFCVPELQILNFLTQKENMVMQISAASTSRNFHSGKSYVKKITVYTLNFYNFAKFTLKLRSWNQKLLVWVFQGQGSAFGAAINISYRKITAKKVTIISFLSLISLKTVLVLSTTRCRQKRLNCVFLMDVFAKIFVCSIYKKI